MESRPGRPESRRSACQSLTPALPSVLAAREMVREFLAEDIGGDLLDDLVLVTSELVTNAVKFGERGDRIWLHIVVSDREIAITVSGRSRGDVAVGTLTGANDSLAESGRGLRIVRDLSDEFTIYRSGLTMVRSARIRQP